MELKKHTAEQYRDALLAMLPQGKIWDEERSNQEGELYKLCGIWAEDFVKFEEQVQSQITEASPLTAEDTLNDWAEAAGVSTLESNKLLKRIQVVAALIGSMASTKEGLKNIAKQLDYDLELVKTIEHEVARCGSMRCGDRLYTENQSVQRQVILHSQKEEFQVLAAEIAAESVAFLGDFRCGAKLWPREAAIHETIATDEAHEDVVKEVTVLESLLPAQWQVDLRFV